MNNPQNLLSDSQKALVADLVQTYGISPDEITFFHGDPLPLLGYEASCILANTLAPGVDIDVTPIESMFVDSLAMKCEVVFPDRRRRSAVGVVNANEKIGDKVMEPQQRYHAATSRALRNAFRISGIDLLKRHEQRNAGVDGSYPQYDQPTYPVKTLRETLLARV